MSFYGQDYTDNDADLYDETGRRVSGSGEQHSGQVRMAYRLARAYVDRLLFVHGIGWHWWDGKRWAEDDQGHARRAVLDILQRALAESVGDKQMRADVARCESEAGVCGVLGIASALVEFAVTVRDLDVDPWLLNAANGTLDLRTRQVRPHDPRDRLSRVATGAYDPDASDTAWASFLGDVLPDEAERAYLQRVIGQAVHGTVREHVFPVLIGEGANGKSTAYGAICHALGDYATIINPDLLMVRERGGIGGPELMTLLGARLVIGSETEDGRKLDEATMKRLTGGDELTARRLYREPITWKPSHQLVYVTNALPQVKGNDAAVWRRIRVVPFDVVVPPEKRDPGLPDRLALHADAILTWAVAGYFDYKDHGGMREPESVLTATGDYQAGSDPIGRFITEACETGPYLHEAARALYAAWQQWASSEGAEQITEKAFNMDLDRRGYESRRTKTSRRRQGLRLRIEDTETGGGDRW
ncbi:Bacteriophage protein [Nostocoides japonicum T1-X7]|uniref:Bacteriophage protein n=1 Tax=Nostocoides japonicum T1-X7 TaxID=1194083 RepID=A0A077M0M0_9MICO|nr:phage/plasmid primase, P4 family [Tetrasphaera japonica]CCH77734.1 Bacteriophage protein [Tetrasphaera japonica T1-X7]